MSYGKTGAVAADIQEASKLFEGVVWPVDGGDGSVAVQVLDEFGLETGDSTGSSLPGYDIRNRRPYEMIQLSLTAEAIAGSAPLEECYADEKGRVKFHKLGTGRGIEDIYYSLTSEIYQMECNNVLVHGCDPPPHREVRSSQNLFTLGNEDGVDEGPWYHALGEMIPARNTFQEGWIEYNRIESGIDREKTRWDLTAFEKIVTFAHDIKIDFFEQGCTDVQFQNTTSRYFMLPGFGDMVEGYQLKKSIEGLESDPELTGVEVPNSSSRKFLNVRNVIVYGYKLNRILFYHEGDGGSTVAPWVWIDTMQPNPFLLRRGEDYVVNRRGGVTKIAFANNVMAKNYRAFYGVDPPVDLPEIRTSNSKFKIHPESIFIETTAGAEITDPTGSVRGKLADLTSEVVGGQEITVPSVFPIDRGETGYAVLRILVEVEWDNPRVYIKDDRDIITAEKLKTGVHIDTYPIVVDNPQAPLAHNGSLIDTTETEPDENPTTYELWQNTDYEQIRASFKGGDLEITLPFLDESQVAIASARILELRKESGPETTYVCGPECNPELGAAGPDDGVINSIEYSYQDSSQYIVSVQTGPKWKGGVNNWSNSLNLARVGQVTTDGLIVRACKNNKDFIVRCDDGLELIPCINASTRVICSGDKVKVTIYNNPIGEV